MKRADCYFPFERSEGYLNNVLQRRLFFITIFRVRNVPRYLLYSKRFFFLLVIVFPGSVLTGKFEENLFSRKLSFRTRH